MTDDNVYSNATRELTAAVIEDILSDRSDHLLKLVPDMESLTINVLDIITPYLIKSLLPSDTEDDPEWMLDIANKAVQQNLNEDGSCKYKSSQGYACALSAVKLTSLYIPEMKDKGISSKNKSLGDEEKIQILTAAKEIYDFYNVRFGEESAVKQVVIFVAEKYGIIDWNDLGLHPEQQQDIKSTVIKYFEGISK